MTEQMKQLKTDVEASEMVLVGVGEEMEAGMAILESTEIYKRFLVKIGQEGLAEDAYDWMYPAMIEFALREKDPACRELIQAYQTLGDLLQGKNFFLVSMNMDSGIDFSGLNRQRITSPFGSYQRMQCIKGCHSVIEDASSFNQEIIHSILDESVPLAGMRERSCSSCGEKLTYNTVNAEKYDESGYLDSWKAYQKWLTGVVNRKLCILELGVNLNVPGIIRFPFEKIGFYNQKAAYYRINEHIPQLTPELAERGTSVRENAVRFLCGY